MRIGVIQASSQAAKNQMIYDAVTKYAPKGAEVIIFGCTMEKKEKYSYIHEFCIFYTKKSCITHPVPIMACGGGHVALQASA